VLSLAKIFFGIPMTVAIVVKKKRRVIFKLMMKSPLGIADR
jgi:hypothetical protein